MSESPDPENDDPPSILRELLVMTAVAVGAVAAISVGALFWSPLSSYLYLLVGGVFVVLPYWLLESRGWSFERFGLASSNWGVDVGVGLLFAVVTFLPFLGGYWVWKTEIIGERLSFDWNHFLKWNPRLEGAPSNWGTTEGVWIWRKDRKLHFGLRSGLDRSLRLRVSAGPDADFETYGAVKVAPPNGGEAWTVEVSSGRAKGEVVLVPTPSAEGDFPDEVTVHDLEGAKTARVYVGPGGEPRATPFTLERGLGWLGLWLITQVFFIALPEEFFYRGYLQTRIGDWLRARRSEAGESPEQREWWGVTEANLAASAMFGLGHVVVPVGGQILLNRISVAIPAVVFGWLRDRTGQIVAPVTYHAACNMMVLVAAPHFF